MKRFFVFSMLLLACLLVVDVSKAVEPNIWKKFKGETVPSGVPDIIDWSYAGYKNGREAIPYNHTLLIYDVTTYGAIANDGISDTRAIRQAVAAANRSGGIVFFSAGQFDVMMDGDQLTSITITGSDVIIRGSGMQGVTNNGGGTTLKQHNRINDDGHLFQVAWHARGDRDPTYVSGTAPRGTKSFNVVDATKLRDYPFIVILADNLTGTDWAAHSSRPLSEMLPAWIYVRNGIDVAEMHEIDRIENNTVYVKAPIMTPVNSNFKVYWQDMATGIGFEHLHIDGGLGAGYTHYSELGRNAIMLRHAANSWIKNCRFSNVIGGFLVGSSYGISVLHTYFDGNYGHGLGNVSTSTYCLVNDLTEYRTTRSMWHAVSVAHKSAGTVLWNIRGSSIQGPDVHSTQPRWTLFDNYESTNHHSSGGHFANFPHHLDGYVRWNNTVGNGATWNGMTGNSFNLWTPGVPNKWGFAVTQASLIGYKQAVGSSPPLNAYVESFGTHVTPQSLYQAQLARRTDSSLLWTDSPETRNYSPTFTDGDETVRSVLNDVSVGSVIGEPITATDQDSSNVLAYYIGPANADLVDVDISTGQLRTKILIPDKTGKTYKVKIYVFDQLGGADSILVRIQTDIPPRTPLSGRIPAVVTAIFKAVQRNDPTVINRGQVTKAHISQIRNLVVTGAAGQNLVEDFLGLKRLEFLDLSDNEIGSLPSGVFRGLGNLKKLYLSGNDLTILNGNHLSYLPNLEDLEIIDNDLVSLSADVFRSVPKLKYLDLGGNMLTSLPDRIFRRLPNLITLNLDYNLITSLPDRVFRGLSNLKYLSLAQQNWKTLAVNVKIAGNATSGYTVVVPTYAPFQMDMEVSVKGAYFYDLVKTTKTVKVSIEQGTYESDTFFLVKDANEQGDVFILDIKQLPALPQTDTQYHWGYTIEKVGLPISLPIAPLFNNPLNTAPLANFPNPFNPETWIPYQLAKPSDVRITIYDLRGSVVRELNLGRQPAGFYLKKSRAAHWDGKNEFGEHVASGVYIYQFQTGSISMLRKMVIRK